MHFEYYVIWLIAALIRLRAEADRAGEYMCEVNQLKEQLASRDRVVIEVNSELESVRQQMTKLNSDYQTTLHQLQLTQNALYVSQSRY